MGVTLCINGFGIPSGSAVKSLPAELWRWRFSSWVRKIPWGRVWQPTQVFFPRESHRQRSLWAAVQSVTKSQTCLKQLRTPSHKGIHLTDSFRTVGGGHLEKVTSGRLANWIWVLLTLSLVFRMYILSIMPIVRDIFKDHTSSLERATYCWDHLNSIHAWS